MEIYKLGELATIIGGTKASGKIGDIPIVGSGGIFGFTNKSRTTDPSVSIPRKGTMEVAWYQNPVWNVDTTYLIEKINEEKIILKYLYYNLLKGEWKILISGSTRPAMTKTGWESHKIHLPNIFEQQSIIDIIAPVEKLYLKYSNLVRIDTVENSKKDVQNLIDIIEPIEKCILNVKSQIKLLKNILQVQYEKTAGEYDYLINYIELNSLKFKNQKKYLATNAISEFGIDYSKIQNIDDNKRPSRANLSPKKNSLIISKLDGENKVFYVDESFPYVVSTGFFNFSTDYLDHVTGFILNESFKKQKSTFSTGTTMVGLNNENLVKIKLSKPKNRNNTYTLKLSKLLNIEKELNATLDMLVKLLIK